MNDIHWNSVVKFEGKLYTVAFVGNGVVRLISPVINLLNEEAPENKDVCWASIKEIEVEADVMPRGMASDYVDLTAKVLQGKYEHKQIDFLSKPGIYKLPFKFPDEDKTELIVKVIKVGDFYGQFIDIETNGQTFEFQYNGVVQAFYPATTVPQTITSKNIKIK